MQVFICQSSRIFLKHKGRSDAGLREGGRGVTLVDVVGGGEGQLGLVVAHLLGGQDTQLIKGRPEINN